MNLSFIFGRQIFGGTVITWTRAGCGVLSTKETVFDSKGKELQLQVKIVLEVIVLSVIVSLIILRCDTVYVVSSFAVTICGTGRALIILELKLELQIILQKLLLLKLVTLL